jgi:hypothetical protein
LTGGAFAHGGAAAPSVVLAVGGGRLEVGIAAGAVDGGLQVTFACVVFVAVVLV